MLSQIQEDVKRILNNKSIYLFIYLVTRSFKHLLLYEAIDFEVVIFLPLYRYFFLVIILNMYVIFSVTFSNLVTKNNVTL